MDGVCRLIRSTVTACWGTYCNDQISITSALFDQHKARYGYILIQINKTIQAQSFINRYSKSSLTDNCTLQTGGRTHVTTAFGDGLSLQLGLLNRADSAMSVYIVSRCGMLGVCPR